MKNVRVLITAGPTWVALDAVRVISNTATGDTGIALANALAAAGAEVTLLLGPSENGGTAAGVRVIRFRFFDELRAALDKVLAAKRFEYIVHAAAVSDFAPAKAHQGKIRSGKGIVLALKPLPKLLAGLVGRGATVVMFKFEPGMRGRALMAKGERARRDSGSDYVVANTCGPYEAYLMGGGGVRAACASKRALIGALKKLILG
jgi:phosphopantothenoylcysteine synthetase/decarboxylase